MTARQLFIPVIKQGHTDGTLEQVDMNILTSAYPYNAVLIFVVENNGTIPVACEGMTPVSRTRYRLNSGCA